MILPICGDLCYLFYRRAKPPENKQTNKKKQNKCTPQWSMPAMTTVLLIAEAWEYFLQANQYSNTVTELSFKFIVSKHKKGNNFKCSYIMNVLIWLSRQRICLGSNSAAPSPPCFYSGWCFISFVALSFESSLHQRFVTRQSGCRKSCSRENWSVSAQLKPADGVAYRHYCRQRPVLEQRVRHLFKQPINSSIVTCHKDVQRTAASWSMHSLKLLWLGKSTPWLSESRVKPDYRAYRAM